MKANLDNSKDIRNQNTSLIDQTNQTNFKNHSSYFDQSLAMPQK